jgi:hypothetical protein
MREGEGMPGRTRGLLLVLLVLLAAVCLFEFFRLRSPVANVSGVEVSGSIGVYWDAGCRNATHSIDWGVLSVGESKDVVVYVRNEGSETVLLSMATSNFLPASAADYLSLTFNCSGHNIRVNDVVEVTVTLFVSPGAKDNSVSFDMVFEGKNVVGAPPVLTPLSPINLHLYEPGFADIRVHMVSEEGVGLFVDSHPSFFDDYDSASTMKWYWLTLISGTIYDGIWQLDPADPQNIANDWTPRTTAGTYNFSFGCRDLEGRDAFTNGIYTIRPPTPGSI